METMLDYLLFSYGGEIAVLAVTVVFGCLGWAAKQIYKSLVTDQQKEAIAKVAARCVEQVWKTIHGPEKMEMALQYAEDNSHSQDSDLAAIAKQ